ncbi:MAG: hypothetical protein IPP33_04660 [Flavobacteriales bacterium]|nr:hypothetical protein [Flavobacteriales bacterium]
MGGYDPLLGLSYTEIAGRSRSMHKSQGFGAAETRGEMIEYLKLIKGDKPKTSDIFEGIDITWQREPDGPKMQAIINSLIEQFDAARPAKSIPNLTSMMRFFDVLRPSFDRQYWMSVQWALDELLAQTAGLKAEVLNATPLVAMSESFATAEFNIMSRSAIGLSVSMFSQSTGTDLLLGPLPDSVISLALNIPVRMQGNELCKGPSTLHLNALMQRCIQSRTKTKSAGQWDGRV